MRVASPLGGEAEGPQRLSRERGTPVPRPQRSLGALGVPGTFLDTGRTIARSWEGSPDPKKERNVLEEPEETLEDEEDEPVAAGAADAEPPEASLDEIIAKKADEPAPEEEAEETLLEGAGREERVEPLAVKVVPQQPTEFVCKSCYLVRHRSQLADKKRTYCRDCA